MRGSGSLDWYRRGLETLHGFASYWSVALAGWIAADVAGRSLFDHPLSGTAEMVAYSLPFATFLQIAYVLRNGSHIRSPLFDTLLGPRWVRRLACGNCAIGAALFGLAAAAVWSPMLVAWRAHETVGDGVMEIPAGPLWSAIFAGCVLMVVQFCVQFVEHLHALRESGAGGTP